MFHQKRLWFRTMSGLLAALHVFFLTSRGWAEVETAARDTRARQEQFLRSLAADRLQVENPKASAAQQQAEAVERRKRALEEIRHFSEAEAQEAKAQTAKESAEKMAAAEPDGTLRRALAKAKAMRLSGQTLKDALAKAAPTLTSAFKAEEARPRPSVFAPKQMQSPAFRPPAPRRAGLPQHDVLPPELREFYAALGPGHAYVEADDGSLLTVEEVLAGSHSPEVRLASLATDVSQLPLVGMLPAPTAEDLAETPETRRTPEIQALVTSLGGTALALYNYVHTRVVPELYYGSRKGAAETLAEGKGNDFDQASLLVALLRQAGIPARYEYGAVSLSQGQAMALTGAADVAAAAFLLSHVGVPAAVGTDGKTVVAERVWVRAYVPYGDYRDTGPGGKKIWVRLDPGMKLMKWTQGVNLRGLVHFNFDAYLAGLNSLTPREVYEGQLLAAAKAKDLCNTLEDALSKATVTQSDFRLLPAEHPAKVERSLLIFSQMPDSFRYLVEFNLDGVTQSLTLAEVQGRNLTLRYVGTSPADVDAIAQAGGIAQVVPYQVQVSPVLRLDGVEVKRFHSVNPGVSETLTVKVTVPDGSPALATHHLTAGSVYALLVSGGAATDQRVDTVRKLVQSRTGEEAIEAQALLALALYSNHQELDSERLYALQGHRVARDVLEAVAGRELKVEEAFGTPVALAVGKYSLDVGRDALTPLPVDGNNVLVAELVRVSGFHGSVLEYKVWQEALSTDSVSAVKLIQVAAKQGVPVYHLSQTNNADRAKLALYSQTALTEIDGAIAAGWNVTVPQHPVNYAQYQNQEAYILENPVTGTAAYRINLALNGSESSGQGGSGAPADNCPVCGTNSPQVGSTVDLARGNWRESFTDLTLPAIGLPIVWSRTYASQATGLTELGYGWMHSYGMFLRPEADGGFTYFREDWREERFTKSGSTYVPAAGWYDTLMDLPDGQRLRTKDGVVYEFNAAHKLRSMQEPSGNRVDILYVNGLISQVKDSNGQAALSFSYGGNHISQVTDQAGRVVSYQYMGDDLVTATDVLGHAEKYAYDGVHNLVQRTDKRGKVWLQFFDLYDRWVGSMDPLGQANSAVYDMVKRSTVFFNRTGAAWLSEYNATGNPVALMDPLGNRVEKTWDSNFNPLSEKDARGYVTSFTYDGKGNVLTRTEADNRKTTYSYEATFNRVMNVRSTGLPAITNTYDAQGRLASRVDGLGTTTYTYDGRGQIGDVTTPGNAVTHFAYDRNGNMVTVTDATNRVTTLGYDSAGHFVSVKDGNGNTRAMEVDAAGRMMALVDAAGARTELVYDATGNRVSVKDATGQVTSLVYDDAGRLVRTVDAVGNVTKTEYDAEGRVVTQTDARGFRTTTAYDGAGRVMTTTSPDGATVSQAYCAGIAQSCRSVDALGNVTKQQFDVVGRMVQETDALGRVTMQSYDSAGRLKTVSGANQADTNYVYGNNGLLASVTTPALTVSYGYDGRGNRTSVTAGSQVTSYTYDLANRLLSEKNPLGAVTSYTYDAAGNRQTKVDGSGKTTTYVYDANRGLTEVQFQDGTKYQYAYDARGNRKLEKSPTHERQLVYDELSRVKEINDVTLGRTLALAYDANGNRTSLEEGSLKYVYSYDTLNQLKKVTDSAGNVITFEYDADGRRTFVTRPNGVTTSYAYDAAGQVQSILHSKDGNVLIGFAYEYDNKGNRISKAREDGTKETYGYDSSNRLIQVDYGVARTVFYSLDALGNQTSQIEASGATSETKRFNNAFNVFNQLTSRTQSIPSPSITTAYAYDLNGNLTSETAGTQVKAYSWDLDNRLRQVTLPTGAVSSYEYDGKGLRTKQVTPSLTTKYLLDGQNAVEELDAANATKTSYLTNPQVIDEILSFIPGRATYYLLTDALGSIVAIADEKGQIVSTRSYDVYGDWLTTSGTGPDIAYGFTTREHDATGLRYHRGRYAVGSSGRWLSLDRLGQAAGPNYYLYADDHPIDTIDPSGLLAAPCLDTVNCTAFTNFPLFILLVLGRELSYQEEIAWKEQQALQRALACNEAEENPELPPIYRGLSRTDVEDIGGAGFLSGSGVIRSNYSRTGASFDDIAYAIRDPGSIQRHLQDPENPPSPYVAATLLRKKAEFFAMHGHEPGYYVVTFLTSRVPMVPGNRLQIFQYAFGSLKDQELLFPGQIGLPTEQFLRIESTHLWGGK